MGGIHADAVKILHKNVSKYLIFTCVCTARGTLKTVNVFLETDVGKVEVFVVNRWLFNAYCYHCYYLSIIMFIYYYVVLILFLSGLGEFMGL